MLGSIWLRLSVHLCSALTNRARFRRWIGGNLCFRCGLASQERRSHDHTRRGTLSLFAAIEVASGRAIGICYARHRASEFLKFLRETENNVPADLGAHVAMDTYLTHKTAMICRWLARHLRSHTHFTPTSSSWLNQVERIFANLTEHRIERSIHRSTGQLELAIRDCINKVNKTRKPFRLTKSADEILASIKCFCLTTLKIARTQAEIVKTSESAH